MVEEERIKRPGYEDRPFTARTKQIVEDEVVAKQLELEDSLGFDPKQPFMRSYDSDVSHLDFKKFTSSQIDRVPTLLATTNLQIHEAPPTHHSAAPDVSFLNSNLITSLSSDGMDRPASFPPSPSPQNLHFLRMVEAERNNIQ